MTITARVVISSCRNGMVTGSAHSVSPTHAKQSSYNAYASGTMPLLSIQSDLASALLRRIKRCCPPLLSNDRRFQ